jgi:hypothetical protein
MAVHSVMSARLQTKASGLQLFDGKQLSDSDQGLASGKATFLVPSVLTKRRYKCLAAVPFFKLPQFKSQP